MPQQNGPRPTSLVGPIILVGLGIIFLVGQFSPSLHIWRSLLHYWYLILIFLGLGMFWDQRQARQAAASRPSFRFGSALGIVAFFVVILVLSWSHRGKGYPVEEEVTASTSGPNRSATNSVDLQGAKSVRMSVEMGAGELNINGGAQKLMEGDFQFSRSWSNPKIDYRVDDGEGELSLSQDSTGPSIGRTQNTWKLRVNNEVPLDLKIDMGAGQGNLKLQNIHLTNLELNMGAGEVNVDLTGPRKADLNADIEGGVGKASIRLPKDVGVIATASGGLGSIRVNGLTKDGDEYKNEAFGKSKYTIHLTVQGGIGEIDLDQEP